MLIMKKNIGVALAFAALMPMLASVLGTNDAKAAPVNVVFKWKSISAGGYHTCGIAFNDAAFCWGDNGYGQLGNGGTSRSLLPVNVAGGLTFAQVSAGLFHTCGIALPNRDVYCWGRNSKRQLGSGSGNQQSFSLSPVRVVNSLQATSISTDGEHTCVVTGASEVWCWGSNENNGLGTGNGGDLFQYDGTPKREAARLQFSQVSAGTTHTCAQTLGGQGYCWGTNRYAESTGAFTNSQLSLATGLGPRQWYQVSAGESISCGISRGADDRQIFCWGRADYGASGLGRNFGSISSSAQGISTPVPNIPFNTVSAGGDAVCAIATNGEMYCWGGLGFSGSSIRVYQSPTPLAAGLTFESVDAGSAHHCAISTDKDAYCWGDNSYGQLGTGLTTSSQFPEDKTRVTTATTTTSTVRSAVTSTTAAPVPARATTGKPGTTCDFPGQQSRWKGKVTTCTQRGGRLVWR